MAGELAKASGGRAIITAEALTHETEQRKLLGEYVAKHMAEGTDYGIIPGTKNNTLLKPGAEKLCQLFRCIPEYVMEEKTENWETGLFHYRFTCRVTMQADGRVVAEGVGSCSTFESRYRYRTSSRVCPACGKEAIIKGKAEYGGGWLCFKKKDGCGAKFVDGDQSIEGQATGRVVNPDLHDCVNTVLKIAKKRALVDAAIALARCSDIFMQDMEDTPPVHADTPEKYPADTAYLEANRKAIEETRVKWKTFLSADPPLEEFGIFIHREWDAVPKGMQRNLDAAITAHAESRGWTYDDERGIWRVVVGIQNGKDLYAAMLKRDGALAKDGLHEAGQLIQTLSVHGMEMWKVGELVAWNEPDKIAVALAMAAAYEKMAREKTKAA